MDSLTCPKQEFEFVYEYKINLAEKLTERFSHRIEIPFETNVTCREYAYLLMKLNDVPEHFEEDLIDKLSTFVFEKIDQIQCDQVMAVLQNKPKLEEKCKKFIEKLRNTPTIHNNECKHQTQKDYMCGENFHQMYHKIVHSGILTPQLIQLENHNSDVIKDLINQKNKFLDCLSQEQNKQLEDILISGQFSEKEINTLTKQNIMLAEKSRNEWLEKIVNVRNDQKREFYTWIKNTYEDLKDNGGHISKTSSSDNGPEDLIEDKDNSFSDFVDVSDELEMQESYTINLGSQLKTTHNLRLIAADIFKFCSNVSTPHRIQTAMSLYTNSLSAVVLLVDGSLSNSVANKSDFAKLSLSTSENHFPDFDRQIDLIRQDLLQMKHDSNEKNSLRLKTGDVYITRHSNLSEAHVVFHIVSNDSIKNTEINSRHPVILGLRNILKIAYIYDISNIYIPLLLLHRMYEDITMQWCLRRAELILKCVKGFMIEMSSLLSISDSENKTIQFVVPKGISPELFQSLSAIFPNVFRLSNPLFLTSSSSNNNII